MVISETVILNHGTLVRFVSFASHVTINLVSLSRWRERSALLSLMTSGNKLYIYEKSNGLNSSLEIEARKSC